MDFPRPDGIAALVILAQLYRATPARDIARTLAIALVSGGAIGNLIDRVRGPQGVVDFIDIGIGDMRWPTFNVADMAVSTGAILLAWVLWGEEQKRTGGRRQRHPRIQHHVTAESLDSSGTRHEFVSEADSDVRLDCSWRAGSVFPARRPPRSSRGRR